MLDGTTPATLDVRHMSEPGLSEPPTKRQRADKEDAKKDGKGKEPDDDEEFHQLTAVSVVQEELNVLDEEEAQEVQYALLCTTT